MIYPDTAINIMKDINLPCWVAGGYLLSYFTSRPWRDIDIYFPSDRLKNQAVQNLIDKDYSLMDNFDGNVIKGGSAKLLDKNNNNIELMHRGNTPTETIQQFDFTICCCSLNNDGILEYHHNYFDDVYNRRLVYTGTSPYVDFYRRMSRLKKYVSKGYGIDQDNLIQWIDAATDQHIAILSNKHEYIVDFKTIKEPLKNRLVE